MFNTLKLYIICLVAGLLFLLLTILLDAFDGVFNFFAIDIFNFDLGDASVGFIPVSLISLSMWSIVFGALGLCLRNYLTNKVSFIISLLVGYIFAVIVQTIIVKLKKVKNEAEDIDCILKRDAYVATRIKSDGFGSISLTKDDGSVVSFPAKSVDGTEILQDRKVTIEYIKEGVLHVKEEEE